MSTENNTNVEEEVVAKDLTAFSLDEVETGGFTLLPEQNGVLAHVIAVTIERDLETKKFGSDEIKVFTGARFIFEVVDNEDNFPADEHDGREGNGEAHLMYDYFHKPIGFADKSNFMKMAKKILQNPKLSESDIKKMDTNEFFESFIGKPVYLDIGLLSKDGKEYNKIVEMDKANKMPSKTWENVELPERLTENQCNIYKG